MTQTTVHAPRPSVPMREMRISVEMRDGLLQDLVAVAIILRDLEQHAEAEEDDEVRRRLASAAAAVEADVCAARRLIDRLRAAV